MKIRLIYKYIACFGIAFGLSFIFISLAVWNLTYNKAIVQEAEELYSTADKLASSYGYRYFSSEISLENALDHFKAISDTSGTDVTLIGIDKYTYHANYDTKLLYDFDPSLFNEKRYIIGNLFDYYDSDQLLVISPINVRYSIRGYIAMAKPIDRIKANSVDLFNYNYFSLLFSFALLGSLIFLFIVNLVRPINRITRATAEFAKGNFSAKTGVRRSDEIGQLSDSIEYMSEEIGSLSEYQKSFIANISHDFRSPLTSIKGYLEAIKDGTIPPEMTDKYIDVVLSETDRLTNLTENILALNKASSKGLPLVLSDFDIIEIIKHTLLTFDGRCAKKKIKFQLIFCDTAVFVNADKGKITQVIYNLIDNAIKFSNNDSKIIISVKEKSGKILIGIKDFGCGIPKDSIPKIWDRFYKNDLSRGKDKKGSGIGLAIVKEIMSLHNEYIDVVSTEGIGTEFSFSLPKAKK